MKAPSRIQQSFSWDGFARTGIAPEALARGAAEIGYAGVELVEPVLWPLLRDHGLRVVSIVGHPLAPAGLNDRASFDAIERSIHAALEQAAQWSIPYVLCFSGNRYGLSADEAADITAGHLRQLAPAAADAGVTLVLELLNSKIADRDYQADHTAWGAQVCRMVDSPHIRLLYDIFHMQIMEGDLIRTIQANTDVIGHYHTAGNPGRADLDEVQEIHYPAVVRAIAATRFSGFIGHEFFPKHDALTSLRAAYDLCAMALRP
ncbi:MAG TPA: TIM barrel protein [Candidatus Limnocylindrales bacterium]|nr:TIM barrel protein [Candidatus Limnocylindrales bacterium]